MLSRDERKQANDPRLCPMCGTRGKRTSTHREVQGIHRRRQCLECGHRWTALELDKARLDAVLTLEKVLLATLEDLRRVRPEMFGSGGRALRDAEADETIV